MIKNILKRIRALKYKYAIASNDIEDRFSKIYSNNLWFKNGQSRSGSGSTLEATVNIREWLPEILSKLSAKNLIDLGCGDFYWMREILLPCKYIGLDIVPEIIDKNKENYSSELIHFRHHNAVDDSLPIESDIILCREVLFHLSFEDGLKMLNQILKSNARYLIITSSKNILENKDIRTGEFRSLNLNLSPFNFKEPIELILDSTSVTNDRFSGLWNLEELRRNKNL